jgi:hypothetical protein
VAITTTLQSFTKAMCTAASTGIVAAATNNGTGSYTIRKLADGNCYVNMTIQKQWYGSGVATGNCTPSSTSYPACNTCYAINNNGDWFLPSYVQYTSLVSTVGSGGQLYTALGLGAGMAFWSSSEYSSDTSKAWFMGVDSGSVNFPTATNSKLYSYGVLCRHN